MPSIDTNCILRWLLDDVPEQTVLVDELLNSGENFFLEDVALIEVVFVLEKVKKISRPAIEKAVMVIIQKHTIVCNRKLFIEILSAYTAYPKLSFVDCYLEAQARKTKNVPLFTFDKKLANQLFDAKLLS
jgi:predicted nucleic-acid-binding protein